MSSSPTPPPSSSGPRLVQAPHIRNLGTVIPDPAMARAWQEQVRRRALAPRDAYAMAVAADRLRGPQSEVGYRLYWMSDTVLGSQEIVRAPERLRGRGSSWLVRRRPRSGRASRLAPSRPRARGGARRRIPGDQRARPADDDGLRALGRLEAALGRRHRSGRVPHRHVLAGRAAEQRAVPRRAAGARRRGGRSGTASRRGGAHSGRRSGEANGRTNARARSRRSRGSRCCLTPSSCPSARRQDRSCGTPTTSPPARATR